MSYIGNPIVSTDFPVDYASGNNSTTAFTLSIAPASVNSIDVQISGVSQSPQTYSVSGTTLTFSAAPPTGTNNIVVRHKGVAGIPNVPSAGSVVPASIGTGYSLWNLSGSDINYTAGNVGIGTSSPSSATNRTVLTLNNTAWGGQLNINVGATNHAQFGTDNFDSGLSCRIQSADGIVFRGNGAERMRIDSSGNLLVGTTTAGLATTTGFNVTYAGGSTYSTWGHISGTAAGQPWCAFSYDGSTIGSITQNGTTATSYNTTSDYRLKENIAPMTGALDVVSALKPVTYTWKADGSSSQGFIAHELQAIVPECVTGEKDAVDEEGNPVYQGIDTSFLVATLTAAIQELKAELDATKAEVAALKAGA